MGTRGAFGVRVDDQDRLTYNHYDSYPTGLGRDVVRDINAQLQEVGGFEQWREKARALRAVKNDDQPTEEDKERLKAHANLSVSGQSMDDWYCLLRECQGELAKLLDLGVYIDNHAFMADSLFCEWAYVVNLDNGTLEVYRGFQKSQHNLGRYATMEYEKDHRSDNQYYPVALVGTFPLHEVTLDDMDKLESWDYYNRYPEEWEGDKPDKPEHFTEATDGEDGN